jgi:hypothetical protein
MGAHLSTLLDAGAREDGRTEKVERGDICNLVPTTLALPVTGWMPTTGTSHHRCRTREERD